MSGAAASAAAAKRRQQLIEEEEVMTPYSSEDLKNDWKFKIVRSSTYAFRKPEKLRQLIEDEARAGWVLVEKFDDTRVRFKRPVSARQNDSLLPADVDPYRTNYGMSEMAMVWVIIGVVLAVTLSILLVVLVLAPGAAGG